MNRSGHASIAGVKLVDCGPVEASNLSVVEMVSTHDGAPEVSLRVVAVACRAGELVLTLPAPARHHNVLRLMTELELFPASPKDQGFLLSDGSYADRRRALKVATAAGQVFPRKPGQYNGPELFSEDVW